MNGTISSVMMPTFASGWETMIRKFCFAVTALFLFLPSCGQEEESAGSLLREKDVEFVRETLGEMERDVRLVLATSGGDCEFCSITEGFLEDIAELASRVQVEIFDLEKEPARAEELGMDKAPGIAVIGEKDFGIRYYGLPTGYEFITFIGTIRHVANGDPGLLPETEDALAAVDRPVQLTVFSTKT